MAMEAAASGVPTILAANTGQIDLVRFLSCGTLPPENVVQNDGRVGGGAIPDATDAQPVLPRDIPPYEFTDGSFVVA